MSTIAEDSAASPGALGRQPWDSGQLGCGTGRIPVSILVDKDDSLINVGARVLVNFIATNISLAIARVTLLNCCRSRIGNWRW